jgi:glutaredoxin
MTRFPFAAALAAALAAGSAAAQAPSQYKVVGPDGSVTYTDRPPVASNAKVTAVTRRGGAPIAADADLPFDLRQVAARFPVTLYTTAECVPCDNGRLLLQARGVPFTEKRIASEDDAAALDRIAGGRTVPSLTVGSQVLRGLSQTDWVAYLDAAGYPKESKLPRNWQAAAPTPLVEKAPAAKALPPPVPVEEQPAPTVPSLPATDPNDTKIRF